MSKRIEELEAELQALRKVQREEHAKRRIAKNERIQELKKIAEYDYTVTEPRKYFSDSAPRAIDYMFVHRKVNETLLANINHTLLTEGFIDSESEGMTHEDFFEGGMTYYFTSEGIVHHCSGGSCILDTPQLCNPEEWEQLRQGNIPTKLIKEI